MPRVRLYRLGREFAGSGRSFVADRRRARPAGETDDSAMTELPECHARVGYDYPKDELVGTVTLYLDTPPNQPFRAEIWKLMVHPDSRRRGIAQALMRRAEQLAIEQGRTLLNLDTAIEGGAEKLYEGLGWVRAGTIPGYAFTPYGDRVGTAIYYKML